MFNTMKTAKQIRAARIAQNMTQMNLADAMEVSYQAVSNWERGNSMPDISKLEQLCRILQITMDELLGSDSATRTLNKIIYHKEFPASSHDTMHSTPDTATDTAAEPITNAENDSAIEPITNAENDSAVEPIANAENDSAIQSIANAENDSAIETIANTESGAGIKPMANPTNAAADIASDSIITAESDTISQNDAITLEELRAIAPLLPPDEVENLLDNSMKQQNGKDLNLKSIIPLAPFLDEDYLDALVKDTPVNSLNELTGLLPFLSEDTLDKLALQADPHTDMKGITALAPFLSEDTLDKLVTENFHWDSLRELASLAPHLSEDTLDKLALQADPKKDMSGITAVAPFLSAKTLRKLADRCLQDDEF